MKPDWNSFPALLHQMMDDQVLERKSDCNGRLSAVLDCSFIKPQPEPAAEETKNKEDGLNAEEMKDEMKRLFPPVEEDESECEMGEPESEQDHHEPEEKHHEVEPEEKHLGPEPELYRYVDTLKELYTHDVFHKQVQCKLVSASRHRRRRAKESVLSMYLNLDCVHSHPEFRDTLKTIKCVVGMLVDCSTRKNELLTQIKQVPYDSVANHLLELYKVVSR